MKVAFTVGGTTYYLSRLDTSLFEKFLKWADTVLPNPLDVVREQIKGFPEAIQLEMVKHAQTQLALRHSGKAEDVQALMHSPQGARKFIALALSKYQPSLTDEEVATLIVSCEQEHGVDYLREVLEKCTLAKPPTS